MYSWSQDFYRNPQLHIVQYDPASQALFDGGVTISGLASYTLAQFQNAAFDLSIARFVHISDVHSNSSGYGGSLWRVDPLATTQKRILHSDAVCYASLAAAIAAFPPASYPGLSIRLTNWDATVVSKGGRYVPKNRKALLGNLVFGTLAVPTANIGVGTTTYDFNTVMGTPTFPANMFAIGDKLMIRARKQRHNANAVISAKITLGTTGTNVDAYIWQGGIPATDLIETNINCFAEFGSATNFTTNSSSSQSGTGGLSQLAAGTANVDISQAMILSVNGNKNANDTLDLMSIEWEWIV